MKKLILLFAGLIIISAVNAQSLDEIIKRYTVANKLDKVSSLKTIKITGKMSMMGMEMPMTMWMKNPDKIKTVTSFNGQDMVQVFDGVKGYTINPMTGSSAPVEMTAEEIKQAARTNMFHNYLAAYLKSGQLAMEGEEIVNARPAYKLKATIEGGNVIYIFIDKSSSLMVKVSTTVTGNGMTVTMDSFPSDYTETNGIILPMKTTSSAQGMEFVMNFTKVEIDTPMDDSIFKVN
jgi:zinc protease